MQSNAHRCAMGPSFNDKRGTDQTEWHPPQALVPPQKLNGRQATRDVLKAPPANVLVDGGRHNTSGAVLVAAVGV